MSLNRCLYANNNPLLYLDPDGDLAMFIDGQLKLQMAAQFIGPDDHGRPERYV